MGLVVVVVDTSRARVRVRVGARVRGKRREWMGERGGVCVLVVR